MTSSVNLCDDSLTHFIKALVLCRDPLLETHGHAAKDTQVMLTRCMSLLSVSVSLLLVLVYVAGLNCDVAAHTIFALRAVPQDSFSVESDAVVVVELLTAVAIRNPTRAAKVWPVLHAHFWRLLEASPEKREYLLERVTVNLMRGCVTLLATDDVVISSLKMLTGLRPDITSIVAPRIAAVRACRALSSAASNRHRACRLHAVLHEHRCRVTVGT